MAKANPKFTASLPDNDRPYDFYIGIDPSFTGTGLIMLETYGKLVHSDVIATSPALSLFKRTEEIAERIPCYNEKSLIVIEEPFCGANPRVSQMLAVLAYRLRTRVRHAAILNVTNNHVKAFAASAGAKKSDMKLIVYKNWGYDTDDDNLADAYTMARIAMSYATFSDREFQRAVMGKIKAHHAVSMWST